MNLIIDFLLLAASGAACFYCWVLNSKLQKLSSSKDGLAAGVAALSQSAEDMQSAIVETKGAAGNTVAHLESLLKTADERRPELQALLEEIQAISNQAVSETEIATANLVETLAPHIAEARKSASFLFSSLEKVNAHTQAASAINTVANSSAQAAATNAGDEDTDSLDVGARDEDELEFVLELPEDETEGEAA